MTIAVLAAPVTKIKCREPLGTIGMAGTQAQSRSGRGRPATRLSASQNGLEELANNDGKRKANYEEDSEGFRFSRKPTKRPRASVEPISENPNSDVENAHPKSTPKRGRPPKKRPAEDVNGGSSAVPAKGKSTELPTRKPKRTAHTADVELEAAHQLNSTRPSRNHESPANAQHDKKGKRGRPARSKPIENNGFRSPELPAGKTVPLPTSDTPVIQRNKEFRGAKSAKGRRRSSLGMRGRRASSLIDSGASNALPHREVGTADFYKHIADEGLPEPRRMRQLLIWCATRALGEKPSGSKYSQEDQSARLAARVIQDELLKDFSSNSDLSNWFSREDLNPPTVIVKKPNPRNVQNTDKIKELEEQIHKLQKERQALNALLKQPPIPPINPAAPEFPKSSKRYPKNSPQHIDSSLLDPSQQAILASLQPLSSRTVQSQPSNDSTSSSQPLPPIPPSAVSSRLSKITTSLAPTMDSFAAGIHDIELYRSSADAVSSRILRVCAERLEERDALNTQRRLAIEGDDGEQSPQKAPVERPREDLGIILGALSRVERR
ncbi:uncharacterized protein N7483_005029 [Penicillium malachiteum]|uniref:uncharacterized protein n=1 Tax=Penicillium malachiteum TaxID=1324776 RepID=UPI002549B23C|nr:uncharacterized protein N7483_005029 [Penicillium malachiteum]KAJ5730521.1 hypothetical protein N7483_005029 [Penicillium malachiteum]